MKKRVLLFAQSSTNIYTFCLAGCIHFTVTLQGCAPCLGVYSTALASSPPTPCGPPLRPSRTERISWLRPCSCPARCWAAALPGTPAPRSPAPPPPCAAAMKSERESFPGLRRPPPPPGFSRVALACVSIVFFTIAWLIVGTNPFSRRHTRHWAEEGKFALWHTLQVQPPSGTCGRRRASRRRASARSSGSRRPAGGAAAAGASGPRRRAPLTGCRRCRSWCGS
mmetsp:Transcript_4320/g.7688  ORF Transcript_4320/g.7688 Transcript_4320/m.7688 type:complete len:224 (-) Transcript_4320:1094-1765(-)